MKTGILIALSLMVLAIVIFPLYTLDSDGQAINIIGGDVFGFETVKYKRIRVYLSGIDTPNPQEKFGKQSRDALRGEIHFKNIKLENIVDLSGKGSFEDKKYTVYSAEVFVNDKNINEYMVLEGFAYADGSKYKSLEAIAKTNRKGLWESPWTTCRYFLTSVCSRTKHSLRVHQLVEPCVMQQVFTSGCPPVKEN